MKILFFTFFLVFSSCGPSTNGFKLCSHKKYPYYHPALTYKGGFYAIKEFFLENYEIVNEGVNTGIVRVQFEVNCLGETGNYEIANYSLEYKKIELTGNINNQLIRLTRELRDWIPAKNEFGENIDSHKFFAFKLVNGNLVDILPK